MKKKLICILTIFTLAILAGSQSTTSLLVNPGPARKEWITEQIPTTCDEMYQDMNDKLEITLELFRYTDVVGFEYGVDSQEFEDAWSDFQDADREYQTAKNRFDHSCPDYEDSAESECSTCESK